MIVLDMYMIDISITQRATFSYIYATQQIAKTT